MSAVSSIVASLARLCTCDACTARAPRPAPRAPAAGGAAAAGGLCEGVRRRGCARDGAADGGCAAQRGAQPGGARRLPGAGAPWSQSSGFESQADGIARRSPHRSHPDERRRNPKLGAGSAEAAKGPNVRSFWKAFCVALAASRPCGATRPMARWREGADRGRDLAPGGCPPPSIEPRAPTGGARRRAAATRR